MGRLWVIAKEFQSGLKWAVRLARLMVLQMGPHLEQLMVLR
jgi:hypothetical protein